MDNGLKLVIKSGIKDGDSVVYVMSRDQRVQDNHALLAAQAMAIEQNKTLYVLFILKQFNNRSREHYQFMIEGLNDVSNSLKTLKIPFILRSGEPDQQILNFCNEANASALFFDFSPLHGPRTLIKTVAKSFDGTVTVVDTHNIVPTWAISNKQEYAAHTLRTKVHQQLSKYLISPPKVLIQNKDVKQLQSLSFKDAKDYINKIPACGIVVQQKPGEKEAHKQLKNFINNNLLHYAKDRNDISIDKQSGLSPYLHFGQISSLRIALNVIDYVNQPPLLLKMPKLAEASGNPSLYDGMNALLEELIVRKELADNFCFYGQNYTTLDSAAEWAKNTLSDHAQDPREYVYNKEQWEHAKTHDIVWNAAQTELTTTGKMHGYMRMYWAKKILEWSISPIDALNTAIYLNDKYSIDGGDPNGYVGILWSIAGLHDRPWFERPVFGKIRYMNNAGLRRKFDVDAYIKRVSIND